MTFVPSATEDAFSRFALHSPVKSSSIQGPVADGSGVIYVGGFGPNRDLYRGLLQDVRAYDRELLPR